MKQIILALVVLLFAVNAVAQHTVKLSWTDPTNDANGNPLPASGPGSLSGHNVKRATALAGPYAIIATPFPSTTYTDATLPAPCQTAGCTLYYEVTAVNSVGESVPLGPTSAVVPAQATAVPAQPTVFIIQVQ